MGKRKQSQFVSKYESSPWYKAYKEAWSVIEKSADQVNEKTFKQILQELYDFVDRTKGDRKINAIPTATLLTGIFYPVKTRFSTYKTIFYYFFYTSFFTSFFMS